MTELTGPARPRLASMNLRLLDLAQTLASRTGWPTRAAS